MRTVKFKLFAFFLLGLSAQLSAQIDTVCDYTERFYKAGELLTENQFSDGEKHGLWIEYFDKYWTECLPENGKYYRLIEYDLGKPKGKVYDFYLDGKLQMLGTFESVNPKVKTGTFVWFNGVGEKTGLRYMSGDTMIRQIFKKGILNYQEVFKSELFYDDYKNFELFYDDGTMQYKAYTNKAQDTIYYLSKRENGTKTYEITCADGVLLRTQETKEGEESFMRRKGKSDIAYYKKQQFVKQEFKFPSVEEELKMVAKYDTVVIYSKDMAMVNYVDTLKVDNQIQYSVNGQVFDETAYREYMSAHAAKMKALKKPHLYRVYSKDSTLLYEAVMARGNRLCGVYRVYYPSGQIRIQGYYNKKGLQSNYWRYFNEAGKLDFVINYY